MLKTIRDARFHTFILLLPFLYVWFFYTPAEAQPVPEREVNSRIVHALEQLVAAVQENTRAQRDLAQEIRRKNGGF